MVPLATAFIHPGGDGDIEIEKLVSLQMKRKRMKAQLMDDGPRQSQKILLIILWIGAGLIGVLRYLFDQNGESPKIQRPYFLRPFPNSSDVIEVVRNTDTTFCKVWEPTVSLVDLLLLGLVLILPILIGPVLTSVIEIFTQCYNCLDDLELPSRWREFGLVYSLGFLALLSHIINLKGAEYVGGGLLGFSSYRILLFKYLLGYMDLVLAPLVIIIWDKDIRRGIPYVYRIKRLKGSSSTSSLGHDI
ncbi:uncharacterized protein LOC111706353 [Eurytemora carolleeae]|uniref:uncharacterized protein LOC111706353 n=1 Tax=Eurytemora carolleeae TaxID=1294199 RepID=UPI000C781140|nr:uncharacterized protein LOC111706353 [Eurytemora carolleeae]|eukprot:XP_023334975.1 uncharacterized protein LOC111706353 [Eurytemora affinis]